MRHFTLRRFLKSKGALETPVANLIILLATVLLASAVVIYAVNLTKAEALKEKVYISTSHIWYISDAESVAGLGISNIGPTSVLITQIEINGLESQWSGTTNYVVYCEVTGSFPGDLPPVQTISNTQNTTITIGGQQFSFAVASAGLTVKSGWSIAFYIVLPNLISINDLSTPVTITLTTAQSAYFTETLVQSI
jgi:hypothetical protein